MAANDVNEKKVLVDAHNLVKKQLDEAPENGSNHYWHKRRVHSMAVRLASKEGVEGHSLLAVRLAALLHDVQNDIYAGLPDSNIDVRSFLESEGLPEAFQGKVLNIISELNSKGNSGRHTPKELAVVQDADILDAIGAIGIARCFTYGGQSDRVMHNPAVKPSSNANADADKNDQPTTLNHFYDRLLKLQALVKTEAGKELAAKRHDFLKRFLRQFHSEWVADL